MMRFDFSGQTAIVTGASSGIGEGILQALVNAGCNVVAVSRRQTELDRLVETHGDAVLPISADVNNEEDIRRVVESAESKYGKIDVAFNVVGGGRFGKIIDMDAEDWDKVIGLNLKSVFLSIKYQAKSMISNGVFGSIVNISSINSLMPMCGASSYSAAKAGVDMLTKNAALELSSHGIRVNALLPGLVETKMSAPLVSREKNHQAFMERIALGRMAKPEEIASPALFLADSSSSYITGATLVADGGWLLTGYPDLESIRAENKR